MKGKSNGSFRIVLTGGPGGGKTTAADLIRRELGERLVVVPEAATLLFSGGFPRVDDVGAVRATQLAVYHLQRNLEDVQACRYPERVLLCDRGTVDGAAYWPGPSDEFFDSVESTVSAELNRYDAVLFFESAAAGGLAIEGGNPTRTENVDEAAQLDSALRALWSRHPNFLLIPHSSSFMHKIISGISAMQRLLEAIDDGGISARLR